MRNSTGSVRSSTKPRIRPALASLNISDAGQGGERIAAVRVRRVAEIIHQQPQLGVAARLVGEAVEEGGEAVHAAPPAPRRPLEPFLGLAFVAIAEHVQRAAPGCRGCSHQWTRASSWPWVTQTSPAPVSRIVRQRSSQSEWSEITRGSSTPFCRARARTRIQPEAKHETGSGKRRDQRSWSEEGGQTTMAPAKLPALGGRDLRRVARGDALAFVEFGQALHRAMEIDRLVVALLADQRHDPLRLAERIGADDMGALGKERDRVEQLADLVARVRVAEHRQAEGRLGDEHVAGDHLIGEAGGVARRACSRPTPPRGSRRASMAIWAEPSTWPAGVKRTVDVADAGCPRARALPAATRRNPRRSARP